MRPVSPSPRSSALNGRRARVLLCAALVLGACTADDGGHGRRERGEAASPQPGGRVTLGVFGEPPTLDPYSAHATDLTFALVRPLYPSLFRFAPDGSISPQLASSIQMRDDGARVELRDASWSNGDPITADDVVASIRRARLPSGFARVRRAQAVGARTVRLGDIEGDAQAALATAAFVLPKGRATLDVSGGPFELVRVTPGLLAVYEPNDRYFGEEPYLERLEVQFFASSVIMLSLLADGRLDAASLPSAVNLAERLDEHGLEHDSALGWETIGLDFSSSGLRRAERVAVIEAIDREALAEGLVRDEGRIAHTLFPSPGSAAGPFDRELGRSEPPQETILVVAPSGDELLQLLQRVALSELDGAGIETDAVLVEAAGLYGDDPRSPQGVELVRAAGAPGLGRTGSGTRALDRFPLFQVDTVTAWRPGLRGLEANPTLEGVLWNAARWWWAEKSRR